MCNPKIKQMSKHNKTETVINTEFPVERRLWGGKKKVREIKRYKPWAAK